MTAPAAVVARLGEGQETADLRAARALLAQLDREIADRRARERP